ncbi:YdcH family protein [Pseudomonas schmalbachii]|uniref:DUF465 domain-containing protein n=1 Tax=Pseudomonas schmalbachii TaxID=2816993 RepID=A0ABS3TP28_9PSED|nr:DUF465 domain-containing protein [Pseudomonas schmalbachii]MBO3275138.1 DUF465 domain-containing protein [Pseudomonas schmalbachii]
MPLEHHPLSREFPDYKAKMTQLHGKDAHFTKLATSYEALDRKIFEVEDGREALDDLSLNSLKLQRVTLKDEIAELLKRST